MRYARGVVGFTRIFLMKLFSFFPLKITQVLILVMVSLFLTPCKALKQWLSTDGLRPALGCQNLCYISVLIKNKSSIWAIVWVDNYQALRTTALK